MISDWTDDINMLKEQCRVQRRDFEYFGQEVAGTILTGDFGL